ncbi:dioxygenase family protein [Neomicrococcus lactis]
MGSAANRACTLGTRQTCPSGSRAAPSRLTKTATWRSTRCAPLHTKSLPVALAVTSMTQQLYSPGDPHDQNDIASTVKTELMLDPKPRTDGGAGEEAVYNYVLAKEGQSST